MKLQRKLYCNETMVDPSVTIVNNKYNFNGAMDQH